MEDAISFKHALMTVSEEVRVPTHLKLTKAIMDILSELTAEFKALSMLLRDILVSMPLSLATDPPATVVCDMCTDPFFSIAFSLVVFPIALIDGSILFFDDTKAFLFVICPVP